MPSKKLNANRRLSLIGSALIALLIFASGCKTQEDATAAASQMAATAQTLSSYYSALDHVLAQTQDTYQAQYALINAPVIDLSDTRQQIQLRSDMATQIGELASLFQKLAGSSAASDASAATGKLNDELISIKALKNNDSETKAVTLGIQEIVLLIQQHEEIKAAQKIEPLCHNLSVFFDSESSLYDSLNQAYLVTAKSVSEVLVRNNEADVSPVFQSALQPFGLTPKLDNKSIGPGMQKYLLDQINFNYKIQLTSSQKATDALSAALKEMDARISLVAKDKTMSIRIPPLSLSTTQSWIKEITG